MSKKDSGKSIRDIQEIAEGRPEGDMDAKYLKYYAVVYADADGMGKFLQELSRKDTCEADTKLFSERCLSYDVKAAEVINDYGGMAIYAGGDDLLFLAPLKSRGKTFLACVKIFPSCFRKRFQAKTKFFRTAQFPRSPSASPLSITSIPCTRRLRGRGNASLAWLKRINSAEAAESL